MEKISIKRVMGGGGGTRGLTGDLGSGDFPNIPLHKKEGRTVKTFNNG